PRFPGPPRVPAFPSAPTERHSSGELSVGFPAVNPRITDIAQQTSQITPNLGKVQAGGLDRLLRRCGMESATVSADVTRGRECSGSTSTRTCSTSQPDYVTNSTPCRTARWNAVSPTPGTAPGTSGSRPRPAWSNASLESTCVPSSNPHLRPRPHPLPIPAC